MKIKKNSPTVVIKCQANKRIEEKVEVTMIGNFFGHRPSLDKIDFVVFPKRNSIDSVYEEVDGKRFIIMVIIINYSK